jgi:hypoxanthine phosphoribosyltransferase
VLLKGAFRFARDLTKSLEAQDTPDLLRPYEVEFIKVKSYVNEANEGDVEITGLDLATIENRHVLVLDDLIDSGRSMKALMDRLS